MIEMLLMALMCLFVMISYVSVNLVKNETMEWDSIHHSIPNSMDFDSRIGSIIGGGQNDELLEKYPDLPDLAYIPDKQLSMVAETLAELTVHIPAELRPAYEKAFLVGWSGREWPPRVTLDDIPHEVPYTPNTLTFKTSTHIGQRKLFLGELQFITDNIPIGPMEDGSQHIIVYAGAAPSNHTGMLATLFPNVKFILIDPNPFDIYDASPKVWYDRTVWNNESISKGRFEEIYQQILANPNRLNIVRDLFLQDMAGIIRKYSPIHYFISDIRTQSGDTEPGTLDILWNLAQQYNWICEMKPKCSMLKFRHPFYEEGQEQLLADMRDREPYCFDFRLAKINGIDFIENCCNRVLIYFKGQINLQAWAGVFSTESRLVTPGTDTENYGGYAKYEDKYSYYNKFERPYGYHRNPNADLSIGFDYCGDCSLENLLWERYIAKYQSKLSVKEYVNHLSSMTHRHLRRTNHGYFYKYPYPIHIICTGSRLKNKDPPLAHGLLDREYPDLAKMTKLDYIPRRAKGNNKGCGPSGVCDTSMRNLYLIEKQ